ncbi:TYMS [Mytilus edulis]|uniref:Thymidylate synthase n=1 Tax=Mytilus edulis TaxID=6550 RepID=A0A8S3T1D6_MYTED|nr:TYMS [Mytilus edulis]
MPRKTYQYRKANWENIKQDVNKLTQEIKGHYHSSSTDELWNTFTERLLQSAGKLKKTVIVMEVEQKQMNGHGDNLVKTGEIKQNGCNGHTNGTTRRHDEYHYLDAIQEVMDHGVRKSNRTGIDTLSIFGMQMRYSLFRSHNFLLTTKRVFWRGVAEELLWFVAGCTSGKKLSDKNVKIWDANGSRDFLDGLGLTHREEGIFCLENLI